MEPALHLLPHPAGGREERCGLRAPPAPGVIEASLTPSAARPNVAPHKQPHEGRRAMAGGHSGYKGKGKYIKITSWDRKTFRGYLATPPGRKGPGILLCQE